MVGAVVDQALDGDTSILHAWPPLFPQPHIFMALLFFSWQRNTEGQASRNFWKACRTQVSAFEVDMAHVGSSPSGGTERPMSGFRSSGGVPRSQPRAVVVAFCHFHVAQQRGPGDSISGCSDGSRCTLPPAVLLPGGLHCCFQGPNILQPKRRP